MEYNLTTKAGHIHTDQVALLYFLKSSDCQSDPSLVQGT